MPLRLQNGETTLPRSYIYCTSIPPGDPFRPFAKRAKTESGWRYYEIDASHSPHITAPEALAVLFRQSQSGRHSNVDRQADVFSWNSGYRLIERWRLE